MPLASSRSAAEKRAERIEQERREKERRERLSLPRNCRSSTRVTRENVKRRRLSRAMSEERTIKKQNSNDDNDTITTCKENKRQQLTSPPKRKAGIPPLPVLSPTPYWKVAQERKAFSPTLTRSAKKKKTRTEDSNSEEQGMALAFSPPDQEANQRREQERMEAEEQSRNSRIEEARNNGRLLIYSPNSLNCRNFNMDDRENNNNQNEGEQPSFDSEEQISIGAKSSTSKMSDMSSSQQQYSQSNPEILNGLNEIKQKLSNIEKDRRLSDAAVFHMTANQVNEEALEAERTKRQELERVKMTLESTVSDLKDKLTKEGEEFQAERTRLESTLESANKEFSQKVRDFQGEVVTLQQEKKDLEERVKILEDELKEAREMLSTNEADAKAIEDLNAQLTTMKENESENDKLQVELDKMAEIRTQLESEIQHTEEELRTYKSKLGDSESQLQDALAKNTDLENQLQKEIQTRETSVNDLVERINALRDGKAETFGELESVRQELNEMKQIKLDQYKQITDLQGSFATAQKNFAKEKKEVQASLAELSSALEATTAKLRYTEETKNKNARQQNERIMELEQKLLETNGKLENAVERLSTSDEREDELLRKLSAGDRIRAQLHNRVTQLSGNIRVFVRVRPSIPGEEEKLQADAALMPTRGKRGNKKESIDMESPFYFPGELEARTTSGESDDLTKRIIEIKEPAKDRGGLSERRKTWRFPFDNVFSSNSRQDEVWESVEPLVQSAIDGYPTCIFAYGQTGSGKTYTMLGEPGNEGIITRAVNKMFAAKREIEEISKGANKVEMSVELLEIYNEQVRDLLATDSGPDGKEIPLKLTSQELVGNVVFPASCESEVMEVLSLAQSRRCVKATQSNAESSRSHMVFTLHFECITKGGIKRVGKLNICDLAGSERLGKSGANDVVGGDLMNETKNINKSLSVLSNCIEKLQAGSNQIPYRESKLTFLLKNSLGGNSKTLAIVCCNPHAAHFHESLCSIRFAERVNKVELKAIANFKC